jgi:transcription elongation GreA/GreB family factor
MNKETVRAAVLNHLRDQFESRLQASKKTRSAGNDAESKAEGKYDTLSIEENYLADGLAKQAYDAAAEAAEVESMPLPAFGPDDPIDLGALVELQFADETEWFLLASAAGGTEVVHQGNNITVLSLESPLGSRLIGAHVGDSITTPSTRILQVL